MKATLVLLCLASALCWTPAGSQPLLNALKEAVTGPPTPEQIAAARQKVQQAASNALSATLTVSGTKFFVDSELK